MTVQIKQYCEYRDPNGAGWMRLADDPYLMEVHDWQLALDAECGDDPDLVGRAVFELRYAGITVFDGPATAHSGDDSWADAQTDNGDVCRGRARLVGFTDIQLEQIRRALPPA